MIERVRGPGRVKITRDKSSFTLLFDEIEYTISAEITEKEKNEEISDVLRRSEAEDFQASAYEFCKIINKISEESND